MEENKNHLEETSKENNTKHKAGKGTVIALVIVIILAIAAVVGTWYYMNNKAKNDKKAGDAQIQELQKQVDELKKAKTISDSKTFDGLKYTVPADWKNVKEPGQAQVTASEGGYLLSPDYKPYEGPQFAIVAGAYIGFSDKSGVIDSKTAPEQHLNYIKNNIGAYIDRESAKLTTIAGRQVIIYKGGHTTDDINVLFKKSNGQWVEAKFSTSHTSATNTAENSPYYKTFLAWLEKFMELNP